MQPNIPSILQKIVQDKKQWIAEKQAAFPLAHFQQKLKVRPLFLSSIKPRLTSTPRFHFRVQKSITFERFNPF